MRRSVKATALLLVSLIVCGRGGAQDKAARAQELLSKAREALGGDHKLKSIQSLWLTAKFQRVLAEGMPQVDGEVELSFLLPDKYKKTETMNLAMAGAFITRVEGFNGEQGFRDTRTNSSGGGKIIYRRDDDNPGRQANAEKATRADYARNLLGLVLNSSATVPLEFSYEGEAQSQDGSAEVIEVKGPEGFEAKLFLDKQTYQPLMLLYRAPQPQMKVMTQKFQGGHQEIEQRKKDLEKSIPDQPETPPKEVDVQIFFSDYRAVDGVMLPHHISKSIDGKPSEEWDVTKCKINPQLKSESFSK